MSKDESTPGIIKNGGTTISIDVKSKKPPPVPAFDIGGKKKKKRGAFSLLKSAIFMLRKHKSKKPDIAQLDYKEIVNSPKGNWQKIVGSMRPLHLQDSPPPSNPLRVKSASVESFDEFNPSGSPFSSAASSSSCASGLTMSQYASANNLQELDKDDDVSDPDNVFDNLDGDELVDAKAEEFIKRFYEQMSDQKFRK